MRSLKDESLRIALAVHGAGGFVRVRERRACRSSVWAAWEVHHKADGAKAGKAIVTLVHRLGTVF